MGTMKIEIEVVMMSNETSFAGSWVDSAVAVQARSVAEDMSTMGAIRDLRPVQHRSVQPTASLHSWLSIHALSHLKYIGNHLRYFSKENDARSF